MICSSDGLWIHYGFATDSLRIQHGLTITPRVIPLGLFVSSTPRCVRHCCVGTCFHRKASELAPRRASHQPFRYADAVEYGMPRLEGNWGGKGPEGALYGDRERRLGRMRESDTWRLFLPMFSCLFCIRPAHGLYQPNTYNFVAHHNVKSCTTLPALLPLYFKCPCKLSVPRRIDHLFSPTAMSSHHRVTHTRRPTRTCRRNARSKLNHMPVFPCRSPTPR